jgi:hypothetical protein
VIADPEIAASFGDETEKPVEYATLGRDEVMDVIVEAILKACA